MSICQEPWGELGIIHILWLLCILIKVPLPGGRRAWANKWTINLQVFWWIYEKSKLVDRLLLFLCCFGFLINYIYTHKNILRLSHEKYCERAEKENVLGKCFHSLFCWIPFLIRPLVSTKVVIKEQLVGLDGEDHIEGVEAPLQQVEGEETLAGNELVQPVTQLAQEETNNTSNNLQSGSITPQQRNIEEKSFKFRLSDLLSVLVCNCA